MQNFVVIGREHFKPEHCKIWSNFEFDRNIVSGMGARTSLLIHICVTKPQCLHPCIPRLKVSNNFHLPDFKDFRIWKKKYGVEFIRFWQKAFTKILLLEVQHALFFKEQKYIFDFYNICPCSYGEGNWNPSCWRQAPGLWFNKKDVILPV